MIGGTINAPKPPKIIPVRNPTVRVNVIGTEDARVIIGMILLI